ncbi:MULTISPECIES: DMT family transporter [unclassified Clostridium]|uniref:DMT family transporter n=1 Tax=unclassified Clostridium TaxID=2614128 RepID=UPI0002972A23|nr:MULTISPECIES: DMT family transporter [unclassified Clostridium]EKQ58047.1 MAG: DMT(drug/metabolite transporter) superfamily permease [Clostridium sp. Maddingley MBC34-26]
MKKTRGELILLLATMLWGTCFVFQKMCMDYIEPYTLGMLRFLLGGLALIPIIIFITKIEHKKQPETNEKDGGFLDKRLYIGGVSCGTALFAAASLQQIGLKYTTAGKAGFLTSLEIVLVAIIMIFLTRKVQINTLIGVFLAVLGMYLLCMVEGFYLEIGDAYELAGTVFWAMQILAIDKYSKEVDGIKLSFVQFITTGILSCIFMLLFENLQWSEIKSGAVPILYTAIIEVAVAYTLQIVGQKYTPPVIAAVILSLEAVFSVISGAVVLGEKLSVREVIGCLFMLAAVVIAQLPDPREESEKS